MKTSIYKYITGFCRGIVFISLAIIMSQCADDAELWTPASDELQITEYITFNDSVYSEFKKAMDIGNMSSILSTRGPFTLFLPDNDAMFAYYAKEGISSLEELNDSVFCRNLVLNHIVPITINTSDIPQGSLSDPNGLGDFMVSEYVGQDIVINKKSILTDWDIVTANGVIHRIGTVIDIVTDNTIDVLDENGAFTIFVEGLKRTGIADTLKLITIPYGQRDVRVRYTLLAVPDTIFAKDNINSFDDLLARFDDGEVELTHPDNGLFKYLDYHCLEGTFYTSKIETGVYPTISRENVVNMTDDYKINYVEVDSVEEFTGFLQGGENILAKNGVIHAIDNILVNTDPEPETYIFDVTDFPDLTNQDCYQVIIKNFFDGENSFEKIKWKTADYMQYYFYSWEGSLRNNDCIVMSEGFWELEVTIPKIKRGKYEVWGHFKKGWNRANLAVYIDDVKTDQILELNYSELEFEVIYITDVDWETTSEHLFKLKTVYPGILMWDYLEFRPIND